MNRSRVGGVRGVNQSSADVMEISKRRITMFCFQCQETAKNTGCTIKGMCGKPEETANLQDLLLFVLRGMAVYGEKLKELGQPDRSNDDFDKASRRCVFPQSANPGLILNRI